MFFVVTLSWVLVTIVGGEQICRKIDQELTEVPGDIPSDTEKLYLDRNNISHVSSDDLLGLERLYWIDIRENALMVFPDLSAVAGTLTVLQLYKNQISSVPAARLNILTKLWKLGLDNNEITSLPDAGGIWLPQATGNLVLLGVIQNSLRTLLVLYDYRSGFGVWAEGNPIVCDEQVAWLLRYKAPNMYTPDTACSAPAPLAGKKLTELYYTNLTRANSKFEFLQSHE